MSTELDLYNSSPLEGRQHYAMQIAKAGTLLPKGVREGVNPTDQQAIAARAFLQMETGSMLGLHPIAALQGINVIEGQPSLKPALMQALVLKAGHKVRKTEVGTVEGGDYACTVTVTREGDDEVTASATWTPHRAARAGLCQYAQEGGVWKVTARSQRGGALPWQSYTEALCFARALSEACRAGAPDVLYGVGYTAEELGAEVNASGEVIDHGEAVVEQQEPAAPKRRRPPAKGRQATRRATEDEEPEKTPEEPTEPAADKPVETPAESPAEEVVEATPVDEDDGDTRYYEEPREPGMSLDEVSAAADDVPMYAEEVPPADDPDALTPEEAEELAASLEPPQFVDTRTGVAYESQEAMDAALKAERQQRQAERAASAPEPEQAAVVTDWPARLVAAETIEQVRAVWDGAHRDGTITDELKAAVLRKRQQIEKPE